MKKIIRSNWDIEEWVDISPGDEISDEEGRQELIDNGEIDLRELAFMQGWEDSAQ